MESNQLNDLTLRRWITEAERTGREPAITEQYRAPDILRLAVAVGETAGLFAETFFREAYKDLVLGCERQETASR